MGLGSRMAAVLAVAALAGCGGGGFGGFGARRADPAPEALTAPLVDQVVSLDVAPTPGGVIVSAVGLPPTQGFWDAELVRVPAGDDALLLLEFRLLPPPDPRPAGTQPSREVLAGTRITDQTLAGVRTIAVRAERNRATSRR